MQISVVMYLFKIQIEIILSNIFFLRTHTNLFVNSFMNSKIFQNKFYQFSLKKCLFSSQMHIWHTHLEYRFAAKHVSISKLMEPFQNTKNQLKFKLKKSLSFLALKTMPNSLDFVILICTQEGW